MVRSVERVVAFGSVGTTTLVARERSGAVGSVSCVGVTDTPRYVRSLLRVVLGSATGAVGTGAVPGDVVTGVVRMAVGVGDMLLWKVRSLVRGVVEGSVMVVGVVCVCSGCTGAGALISGFECGPDS